MDSVAQNNINYLQICLLALRINFSVTIGENICKWTKGPFKHMYFFTKRKKQLCFPSFVLRKKWQSTLRYLHRHPLTWSQVYHIPCPWVDVFSGNTKRSTNTMAKEHNVNCLWTTQISLDHLMMIPTGKIRNATKRIRIEPRLLL